MILEELSVILENGEVNYELLNETRIKLGLSFEKLAIEATLPEPTVKNILTGKTRHPRSDTLDKILKALGLSDKNAIATTKTEIEKQGIKENDVSVLALKEIYEFQIASMKETNEIHISNIRAHYERHIDELRESHRKCEEHYEKRLADKREIIEANKKDCKHSRIFSYICLGILVALLIAEVMNPNLGWFRF